MLTARNTNHMMPVVYDHLHTWGVREYSRNGPVLTMPHPVTLCYTNPMEKVNFCPIRDANPFFHFFESLWMLNGQRDVATVAHFVKRMADYSDDGVIFNAAYGYRIRHDFGRDQLAEVITHLKCEPQSRQAVVQIWAARDLNKMTRDKACLAADSTFMSPEDNYTVKKLAWLFEHNWIDRYPVYGFDPKTGETKLTWMTDCWKVGKKPIYQVKLSNGEIIKATGDHIVWLRNRKGKMCKEVRIDELEIGDTLMAVKYGSRGGYRGFKRNTFQNTNFRNMVAEHNEYMELLLDAPIPQGFVVHHMFYPEDNKKSAICLMDNRGHIGYHKRIDNPMWKISKAERAAKGEHHSKVLLGEAQRTGTNGRRLSKPENAQLESQPVVVSITEMGFTDVYDFTVPETNNAALSNGIFVHNCNMQLVFRVVDGALGMTVFNRSNDAIWGGVSGANITNLPIFQEYIAAHLNLPVGRVFVVSNNLHIYLENPKTEPLLERYIGRLPYPIRDDEYSLGDVQPYRLIANTTTFDEELALFMSRMYRAITENRADIEETPCHNPVFPEVAAPMFYAWTAHKSKKRTTALNWAWAIRATDWRLACVNWLERRYAKPE